MNFIDRAISVFSPEKGVRRAHARQMLAFYEAARPTHQRKNKGDNSSGDALVQGAASTLRGQARHLDQNHDLAKGILNALVQNTVGASGIGVEPQPKTLTGDIHQDFYQQLLTLWNDWCLHPEVTGEMDFARCQRLMARSWFRDGEAFSKSILGTAPNLDHLTAVPMSLELLEADHLSEFDDISKGVIQGIERNAWKRPRGYWFYDQHPGDHSRIVGLKRRRTDASVVDHLKLVDRIGQGRGVSIFAAVMNRLNDLKDYEDSERIAAKISASMAAYIKKGSPDLYTGPQKNPDGTEPEDRDFAIQAGMIIDDLLPGEEIGTMESNRPSPLLQSFRDSMLRATSAGTNTGYSTISRDYGGSYSSQRQELVEQWGAYGILSADFITMFVRPVWRRFVRMAVSSGRLQVPADLDRNSLYDADYLKPSMPWIKPTEEITAAVKKIQAKLGSPQQVIRSSGGQPRDVLDQVQAWEKELASRDLADEE